MKVITHRVSAMALTCAFCTSMVSVTAAASSYALGDTNADGIVNAVDASQVLIKAAELGTGGTAASEELTVMDVNGDGQINAIDASILLNYAAHRGAGYAGTLEEYVNERKNQEETTTRKDFAYYLSLSDYEVYTEYCATYGPFYGYKAQAELPAEEDLPDYYFYKPYVESEGNRIKFWADCTKDLEDSYLDLQFMPELFGFPKEWSRTVKHVDVEGNIIGEEPFPLIFLDHRSHVNYDGVEYCQFYVDLWLDDVVRIDQNYTEEIYDDTIDMYRICLTLENSDFAKQYKHPEEVFHRYSIPG